MLHKSISVIKYFISVSFWVHWAMYCDFKKNSQVSLPNLWISDITVTIEADAVEEKKSCQQSGSVLPVETHKAGIRCGGVGILCICAYQKVYGNSANRVWMWPANCILHLTQLLAGRAVDVDIGCAAGASSSIWWDDK